MPPGADWHDRAFLIESNVLEDLDRVGELAYPRRAIGPDHSHGFEIERLILEWCREN